MESVCRVVHEEHETMHARAVKQVEQRRAFDARRVVLPESIAAEVKAIIAHVVGYPVEGEQVAKRLRDAFPFALRNQK